MKIDFKINKDYLIQHTFRAGGGSKDVVAFQDKAWEISKQLYSFVDGRFHPLMKYTTGALEETMYALPAYFSKLKRTKEFKVLLKQTEASLKACEKEWERNYKKSEKVMRELTGFNFDKAHVTVLITHPSQSNGRNWDNDLITWAHRDDWHGKHFFDNYTTVYMWHEVLHSFMPSTDKAHVLIELATDQELRVRLNGGRYNNKYGHQELVKMQKKMLPKWEKYLKKEEKKLTDLL